MLTVSVFSKYDVTWFWLNAMYTKDKSHVYFNMYQNRTKHKKT